MRFLLHIILLSVSGVLLGQQLPQFSQHMYNQQVLNPAVTGSEMYMVAQLSHRSQWVGFGNSPTTQLLGVHSSINHQNFGIGGYLFNDSYGPFNNFGVNGSYAYHLKVSRNTKLGIGLAATVSQFSVNGSKILLNNDADPLINLTTSESNIKYNGSFGLLLHNEIYYLGVSALNLIQQKDPLYKSNGMLGSLPSVYHFNATGGIGIGLNKTNTIYPSFLVKYIPNNPVQVDVNLRYILENVFEFGLSYRTNDAVIGIVKLYIKDNLNLIYSYDFTTSNMAIANKGSHEITLGYNIYYDTAYKKQRKRYQLKKVSSN